MLDAFLPLILRFTSPITGEGIPGSFIEALAMDKGIVTCYTIGNREMVLDGWNGPFCKPTNCQSLIAAILETDGDFLSNCEVRPGVWRQLAWAVGDK